MVPRWRIRKWERTGWERRSFPECCGCSIIVIRIKCCPEGKPAGENERAGSDVRFWKFAVSQKKMCSELNFAPTENPKVGTSGQVAALVSWVLRFLQKHVVRRKFCPWGKPESWNEQAGGDFRFSNRAVSQKLSPEWNVVPSDFRFWNFAVCQKKCDSKGKFGPQWKSESWNELGGSGFGFSNFAVSEKCAPNEIWSLMKIRKL